MSADGTWNTTINSPMGAQSGTLTLQTSGATLTGKMSGAQGEIALTDGTVDGNKLTWKAAMTNPMPITLEFSAMIDGDKISGTVNLGAFGTPTLTGTRA